MTQNYTGMKKGISLVEMVIAIILFAALATIGLKYTKNFLNTDLQAMKARVAAATDQGNQLVQAFAIYKAETGYAPATINDLNGTSSIMTAIPTTITEMSTAGWNYTADYNGTTSAAFWMTVDLNGTTAGTKSDEQYCALFNREFNTSTELNVTDGQSFNAGDMNATKAAWGNNFCFSNGTDLNATIIIFVP